MAPSFNAGIIGYGTSAKVFHIPFLTASPSFTVHAIVQRTGDAAKEANLDAIIYRSADELFQDEAIDFVVVCTPVETHFDMATRALNAGKHGTLRTLSLPPQKCSLIRSRGRETLLPHERRVRPAYPPSPRKGKLLTVFQNRRWDVEFLTLQKVIADGHLGRIVEFSSHYDLFLEELPAFWPGMLTKPGGSLLHGLGTHLIDQTLVLFGPPSKVTGFLQCHHEEGVEDAFAVMFQYATGLVVTLKSTLCSAEEDQLRFWIRGKKGSFKKVISFQDAQSSKWRIN